MKETLSLITAAEASAPPAQAVQAQVQVEHLDTAKPLEEIFQPYSVTLAKWQSKVESLVVTDIAQKTEMAQARLARLELREARVAMDKTRKGLVEHLKARTGKIDATARAIREQMEALETKLLDSEEFAERHAAKVKAETKLAREAEIRPFMDTPIIGDLSDLSPADYATMLSNTKLARQARIDAALKAEAEAKAKAEADRIERERIATENARLRAEAAETARLAEIERQRVEAERDAERRKAQADAARLAEIARQEKLELDAKANAERKRLEALHAEERRVANEAAEKLRKEHQAAQAKLKKESEEAIAKVRAEMATKAKAEADEKLRLEAARAKAAAAASDQTKLTTFAGTIRNLQLPELKNVSVRQELALRVATLCGWIEHALDPSDPSKKQLL